MKLPTLLGILERAILAAPAGIGDVTIAAPVARDIREEVTRLAVKVASHEKHIRRLESAVVSLQRSNDSYTLAFQSLETSMTAEIKRQGIYDAQLKAQLDFQQSADPIADYPQASDA